MALKKFAQALFFQLTAAGCLFWIFTSGAFVIDRGLFVYLSGNPSLHSLTLRACALILLALTLNGFSTHRDQLAILEPFRTIRMFYGLPPRISLTLLFLAYGLLQSVSLCFMHAGMGTALWDTGFNDQIIWNTAHGQFLINSVRGGQSILGEHFFFFQVFLSAVYRFTNQIEALFTVQSFSIAACIPLIYGITKKMTASHTWSLTLALTLFFYAPLRNGILFPFHSETFADPLLLAGFLLALNEKWVIALFFLLFSMTCKENISMEVLGIGLFFAIYQKRRWGWGVILLALFCLFIIMKVVEPHFAFQYNWNKWGFYSHFTHPTAEAWKIVLRSLFSLKTLEFLGLVFAPVLFAPFASWASLWLLGPTLGIRLLSAFPGFKIITAHYTVGLNAVIFIAAACGIRHIYIHRPAKSKLFQICLLGTALFFTGTPGLFSLESFMWEASFGQNQKAVKILESIPPQISVISSETYLAHLSHRPYIFSYGSVQPGSRFESIEKNADLLVADKIRVQESEKVEIANRLARGYQQIFNSENLAIYLNPRKSKSEITPLILQWENISTASEINYRKFMRKYYKLLLAVMLIAAAAILIRQARQISVFEPPI